MVTPSHVCLNYMSVYRLARQTLECNDNTNMRMTLGLFYGLDQKSERREQRWRIACLLEIAR